MLTSGAIGQHGSTRMFRHCLKTITLRRKKKKSYLNSHGCDNVSVHTLNKRLKNVNNSVGICNTSENKHNKEIKKVIHN